MTKDTKRCSDHKTCTLCVLCSRSYRDLVFFVTIPVFKKQKIAVHYTMSRLDQYIHLYIGCETNKGKFSGLVSNSLFIQHNGKMVEYDKEVLGKTLFLHLRKLRDI